MSLTLPPRISGASALQLAAVLEKRADRQRLEERLAAYKPYLKQTVFHAAGASYRERLFRAGNQLGKTLAGAAEMAMHLTGEYPWWWQGRRFERPIVAWAASKSGESTRDGVQRLLLGDPADAEALGTGYIPKRAIADKPDAARGLANAVDTVLVRHVSGGNSKLKFKSYDQGRERWQAESVDVVWFDEEPPEDIYIEGLSRTNARGGLIYLTFTPLLGVSDVVMRFLKERHPDRSDTVMTIEDAEHISPEDRAKIIASYPAHERDARTRGVPILGSGRIFPIAREVISVEPFGVPAWWPRLNAIDFGWTHPTAAVRTAYDRENDCLYIINAYARSEAEVHTHAATLKTWGDKVPWAWPHDGENSTAGSPVPLADQYRSYGLAMLPEPSRYGDVKGNAVEAGLMDMLDRMHTNRWKVFSNLNDYWSEHDLYHRKDGKVVKERDDIMSAARYACMSIRYARTMVERPEVDRYARRRATGGSGWAA